MFNSWKDLLVHGKNFFVQLESLLNDPNIPRSLGKKIFEVTKSWEKFSTQLNKFDSFVSPITPEKINLPGKASDEFCKHWQRWKYYLQEQFGISLSSYAQNEQLERLFEIADNDPAKAIFYLKFAMSKVKPNFFKVNEETKQTNIEKNESSKAHISDY